jgi:hypothetical protein
MVGTEIFDLDIAMLIKSLKTKLHRLRDKNEVIMTDELGKIKDIKSQAKKRLQQIQLVEKHGTDKQAFLLAYELRKILPETEKSITEHHTKHVRTIYFISMTDLEVVHWYLLLDNG